MPGPLSSTTTTNSSLSIFLTSTRRSRRMSASAPASRELSTPSLTAVSRAFVGALVDVGDAVGAREGGGLAGLLALRRFDRFHLGFWLLLRDLRLGAEHPGPRRPLPDRVPPHEQDDEIE